MHILELRTRYILLGWGWDVDGDGDAQLSNCSYLLEFRTCHPINVLVVVLLLLSLSQSMGIRPAHAAYHASTILGSQEWLFRRSW